MRRKLAVLGLALVLTGGAVTLSALPIATTQAVASVGPTFVVPSNDGYGIAECVASGSACGQVVADAWCEAQGFARSASFGMAEISATASFGAAAARPISVTCAR